MNTTPDSISNAVETMGAGCPPHHIVRNAVPHFLRCCTPIRRYRPTLEQTHPECREPPKEDIDTHNLECKAKPSDMSEDPTQEQ